MECISLEQALQLDEVGPDLYQNVEQPWTFPGATSTPGSVVMALAAAAAYRTVGTDWALDTLHAHFLDGPLATRPLQQRVQRLRDGGRFATRAILVEQDGRVAAHVTCAFVRPAALRGASMQHAVRRRTTQTVAAITLDDFAPSRTRQGPYMQVERLPLVHTGPGPAQAPEATTYTVVAAIAPAIASDSRMLQALGLLCLSDFHVLDAPPTLHGLDYGWPRIGDVQQRPTPLDVRRFTSLNHTVRFHVHEGFRVDDLCYVEATSAWAGQRRAEIQTRIFDRGGQLLATCGQGAYYELAEELGKL